MGVTSTSTTRSLFFFITGISVFFLTSCLHLDTDIRLKKDGGVKVSLTYILAPESADFGRGFGSDEPWPLPLTEKDFRLQSLRVPGVELTRYRVRTISDGSERIDVRLEADSMESLSCYLDLDLSLRGGVESGSLVFAIPTAEDYPEADSGVRDALDAIIGDSLFRFSFTPPSKPIFSEPGIIDGRTAVLEIPLSDILYGRTPDTWEVSW